MLASPALLAEVATVTRRAVDAWRARWGLDTLAFDVDVVPADGVAHPDVATAGAWFDASEERTPATVFWPTALSALVAGTLYPRETAESAWPASSLAAASARHVDAELQRMLREAWSVGDALVPAQGDWQLSRWQAPVKIDVLLGTDLRITALVSGLLMHRVASVPQQASRRLGALDPTVFDTLTSHAELVVGRASLPIPDLAALQVGDVIVLDARIADPLELRIQHGATTLRAAIGTTGPNRAAKIVSHLKS